MAETANKVNAVLQALIPRTDTPENRLYEAMRYSSMAGGKRLRPFLVVQGAALFNVAESCALRAAAAVEMVHTYSLIHDDLPAMDNADLRRGKPTCHKQYDEATAVLAGDSLLTLAFGVLSDAKTHGDPQVRCDLVAALAHAAGALGMCGGQQFDLMAEKMQLDIGAITRLQRLKTGELIAWSCEAGAILGKQPIEIRHRLQAYAHDLGLAFQIADDLLDAEGTEEQVGKSVGRDAQAGKATFVSILGIERARAQASLLADQAARHLDLFGEKAALLREVARFVVERRA
ncbi:MAG: polyprenyl synthetase family protein [Alphaproteobacteria bacterium]|nr:polyprenyl synthetase family protein [Alphaproteobacteria bacterium]